MNTHNAEGQNPTPRPHPEPQRANPARPPRRTQSATASPQEVAPPLPSPSIAPGPARLANGTFAKAVPAPSAETTSPELDLAREVNRIYGEFVRSSAEYHRMLGELLNQVKEDEEHGTFEDWVRRNCRFGLTTAWNCRKVADHWPECQEYMNSRLEANLQRAEDFSFRGFEKFLKERQKALAGAKKSPKKKPQVEVKPAANKQLVATQKMMDLVQEKLKGIRLPKRSSFGLDRMKLLNDFTYEERVASLRFVNPPVECATCDAAGVVDGGVCSDCQGVGIVVSVKLS